ncbi:MAG: YlmH/Sll1252 family protein [Clostridia bacterium]|nr:YlmH/Sll1252 family protein [Clostridia bacterium]
MDIKLLPARVSDLSQLCQKTSMLKFLGFLTPTEATIAVKALKSTDQYRLFGGFDAAERTVLCFMPDWCDEPQFPITAISFSYRNCDSLSHRDFLGALMALGLNRETVGDILVEEGRAVAFVLSDVADFIVSQITKIGSVGVSVQKGYTEPLPNIGSIETLSTTVASLRIDCVVSSLCGLSRMVASNTIADGKVAVNSISVLKSTVTVGKDDIITIRQKGRFKITSCDEYSKKGRIILKYNKYI